MFKVIDSFGEPVRLPPYGENLEPGHIVSITTIGGEPYFTLGTNKNPFGIVLGTDGYTGLVSVACSLLIFKTDIFEADQQYNKGDLLYSNDCGTFTTRKVSENSIPLGLVNDEYQTGVGHIEGRLI